MRASRAASILVVLAAASAGAAPPPDPPIARDETFVKHVNDAIDRGVAWLEKRQSGNGAFPEFPEVPGGTTALAYHTLRVCGAKPDDPAAKSAWTALRRDYRRDDL